MATEQFTFRIGREEGETRTVHSWDALLKWLNKERARWAWLVSGDGLTDVHNWSTQVQQQWNGLINAATSLRSQDFPMERLEEEIQLLYNGYLLVSESKEGSLIQGIQDTNGPEAGAFAYMYIKRHIQIQTAMTANQLRGIMLTAMPEWSEPAKIAERLSNERTNYRSAIRSALTTIDEANQEREKAFAKDRTMGRRLFKHMLHKRRDLWAKVQSQSNRQVLDSIASIKGVENTYLEAMHLQAPVQYWTNKGAEHTRKKREALTSLRWFFPIAVAALIFVFALAGRYLLNHQPTGTGSPLALYVVITGGLALLSTIVFWIGRLLTKLYLSEHHLANDASERAIMTQTYLALTTEGAAVEADRSIILNALFRSTPDGIVKDDGPSELSLQGLLSRLVTR